MALCALDEIAILSLFINILALTRIVKHGKKKTKYQKVINIILTSFFPLKIDVHHGLDLGLLKVSECEIKKNGIVRGKKTFFPFTFLGHAGGT